MNQKIHPLEDMNYNPPLPTLPQVTHQYISLNERKLHVAMAGKGKSLLLVHGWPQHWYVWRKLIPLLSNNYKLIMPDLPGFGWSDMPKDNDFQKETLAKIMLALLDKLQLKQVGLVGHDWGGWIGFLMCLQDPKRFSKYLALGITHPFTKTTSNILNLRRFLYQIPIALPMFGKYLMTSHPDFIEWGIKRCIYRTPWTKEDLYLFSKRLQDPHRAYASSLMYRNFLSQELLPLMFGKYKKRKLHVPTHLLIGDSDPIIHPSLFKNFKNPTNNITTEIVKNCGHFIPEERPEVIAKEITKLFSS